MPPRQPKSGQKKSANKAPVKGEKSLKSPSGKTSGKMADKPGATRDKAAPRKTESGGLRGLAFAGLLLGAFFTCLIFLPTSIVLTIGMMPTFVAMLVDRDSGHNAPFAVGAMNFVGVMPFIIELWRTGHTVNNALYVMARPESWLIMYGAAIGGWGIYFTVPPIVALWAAGRSSRRIADLKKIQAGLEKEWGIGLGHGPESGTAPISQSKE